MSFLAPGLTVVSLASVWERATSSRNADTGIFSMANLIWKTSKLARSQENKKEVAIFQGLQIAAQPWDPTKIEA